LQGGTWELETWGLLGDTGLGSQGSLGHVYSGVWDLQSLRMGSPNFGVPQRGKSLKNREFSGSLASTGAVGHVGWAVHTRHWGFLEGSEYRKT
jgi:hypothetical protein